MAPAAVARTPRRISARRLANVARRLIDAAPLCALSTTSRSGRAHVNTMYFARMEPWDLVWLSAPMSDHSRNIRANSSAAIAIYDSRQRWGGTDRGIQVFGRARELRAGAAVAAKAAYGRHFRSDERILARFAVYRLRPSRLKLFDEREFGGGTFVTARVRPDGALAWERSEAYRDE